jgi:hypothetical protein
MGLSQAQFFAKIKSWVPEWYFESEEFNIAIFQGFAKVLANLQQNAEDHQKQRFIGLAESLFLDLHGAQRGFFRLPRETNPVYASRVRSLLNRSNPPALEALVNSVLIVGTCTIREHGLGDIICANRGSFLNRREVFTDNYYNSFTIIVDRQIHPPYSFLNREYFANRGDFLGSNTSDQTVFDLILEVVNTNKAAGTLYRVLERN